MVKYTNSGLNKVAMKKLLKLKTNNFNGLLLSVSAPFVAIVMLAGMQMVCALSLNDDRSLTDFDDALVPTTGYDDNGPTDFVHLEESPDPHQQRPHVLSELDAYKNHIASTYPDSEYLEGEQAPEYPHQPYPLRDHRVEDNDEDESENLDFLGRFLSMFSMYSTLFELPSFFNSQVRLTKKYISKPAKVPKKYYNESANIIYDVRGPVDYAPHGIHPVVDILDSFKDRLKAIYPGTLWCGDGNYARSEHDVGIFRNTDTCCRMHDKCPASIAAGQTYKNLKNGGLFTRSHCDCDQEFYRCLKKANSIVSNKIGYTYFNILRPQCFRREHPIIGCRKWTSKKCYIYVIDNEKPPIWQWFDNKMY